MGKSGIEAEFEEELRGFFGKKTFEVDQKGQFIRELAGGKAPVPGQQVVLSLSAELQQFAEELLAESEKERDGRIFGIDPADKKRKILKQPWIKGGAIVALDPNNGEVLALASFPPASIRMISSRRLIRTLRSADGSKMKSMSGRFGMAARLS